MDNVTHALAGCLIAAATVEVVERRVGATVPALRTTATVVGVICAELPDADLMYAGQLGMGKLGYLLHHRGYTHTVVFAVVSALVVWAIALGTRRALRNAPARQALLAVALIGTLSHLALDYTNNYGVHPFWPFNNAWYYGDSIFIVEPWLWIASLPALYFLTAARAGRIVFGALLIVILLAAWVVAMVGHAAALALTIGAALWVFVVRRTTPSSRAYYGIAAWGAMELVFGLSQVVARAAVRNAVGMETYRAAALTPFIGNPLCFHAQIVQLAGKTFSVRGATIAPFPSLWDVTHCAMAVGDGDGDGTPTLSAEGERSRSVAFSGQWSAPQAELQQLVATNCDIAAAMRFIRVPQWELGKNGAVTITDVRFGDGGGFASIITRTPPASCPRFVPPWTPPRRDILGTF